MLHVIRKIALVLTREEKRRMGILFLLDLVISIADIAFLALLLLIIQVYTGSAVQAGRFSLLLAGWAGAHSVLLILIFFLLFSGKNLAGFLIFRAQCRFQFRVAARISRNKLIRYQHGDYSDYINIDSSVHIREVSYEPLEFCQHVLGGVQQIITQTVLIALAIGGILLFNASLFFLILVILLPPVAIIFYLIKRKMSAVRGSARISSEKSLQHLQEALSGFVESNIYDKNEIFLNRFLLHQQRYSRYLSNQTIVQGIPSRMIEIFALLGVVILIAMGKGGGGTEPTTVITIGVFMAAAYKIIPGIVKILSLSGQINTYAFTLENLAAKARDMNDGPGVVPAKRSGIRSLRFNDIRFSYGDQRVLEQFNLSVTAGDFVGIAGPSGKGKTTILNLLLGFLTPDAGEIRMNDEMTDAELRKEYWPAIAYVRQQSFLIHDTILNNIILHDYPCDKQRLQAAIETAGLQSLIDSFPEKADKIIMENGRNISGGQRQRIALARALYKKADLIVLDEPFNELDEKSENILLTQFVRLARTGKLIILITHNKKSLSFCNKVVSLEEEVYR
ncbi:MAG TPA: ABC transporter ATP-binding protein [Puia sp.]|nr:ABC transporter ATP-binding protein [Puia sp.]